MARRYSLLLYNKQVAYLTNVYTPVFSQEFNYTLHILCYKNNMFLVLVHYKLPRIASESMRACRIY